MKQITRLIKLIGPVWPAMLLGVALNFATVASGIALMAAAAFLIAAAALHPSIAALSSAIVGVRLFGILRAVCRYGERCASHAAVFEILCRLRVWFYRRVEPQPAARLALWQKGALFAAMTGHIEVLRDFYLRALAPPAAALLVLGAMLVFLGAYAPSAAPVLAVAFLVMGAVLPLGVRRLNRGNEAALAAARTGLYTKLTDTLGGLTDLAAFGALERQAARLDELNREMLDRQVRAERLNALTEAAGLWVAHGTVWLMLILLIPAVKAGAMSGVRLAVVALAVQSSFEAVTLLPAAVRYAAAARAAARELYRYADAPAAPAAAAPPPPKRPALTLRRVSFAYGGGQNVLSDISLALPPGRRLAIVGASGAGKSTLLGLVLGLMRRSGGEMSLNGVEYNRFGEAQLASLCSVVGQETHLFHATIRENILLARPDAPEEALRRAVEGAALAAFVDGLKDGLDTRVGQNGRALSGGQRQRVAIARALLKDAPLVILDEPTVGLDAVTERELLATLEQAFAGRSLLLATHRLAGLQSMDEIAVLDGGRIVERGRWAELLASKGYLYRLWTLQNHFGG